MSFINTDGMAFIGPRSEWFWTAPSGVVPAVTFLAIYRQLRLHSSVNAREQLAAFQREWASERLLRHRLAVFVALRDGADPAHLPGSSVAVVCDFWTALPGHVGDLAPQVQRWRAVDDDPGAYATLEWLAGLMAEMDRRLGVRPFDPAILSAPAPGCVVVLEDAIRVEQALRAVIVTSPDRLTVGQSTAQQAAVADGLKPRSLAAPLAGAGIDRDGPERGRGEDDDWNLRPVRVPGGGVGRVSEPPAWIVKPARTP